MCNKILKLNINSISKSRRSNFIKKSLTRITLSLLAIHKLHVRAQTVLIRTSRLILTRALSFSHPTATTRQTTRPLGPLRPHCSKTLRFRGALGRIARLILYAIAYTVVFGLIAVFSSRAIPEAALHRALGPRSPLD